MSRSNGCFFMEDDDELEKFASYGSSRASAGARPSWGGLIKTEGARRGAPTERALVTDEGVRVDVGAQPQVLKRGGKGQR